MKYSDMIAEFSEKFVRVSIGGFPVIALQTPEELESWLITAFTTIQERKEKETQLKLLDELEDKSVYVKYTSDNGLGVAVPMSVILDKRQSLNKMKGNV